MSLYILCHGQYTRCVASIPWPIKSLSTPTGHLWHNLVGHNLSRFGVWSVPTDESKPWHDIGVVHLSDYWPLWLSQQGLGWSNGGGQRDGKDVCTAYKYTTIQCWAWIQLILPVHMYTNLHLHLVYCNSTSLTVPAWWQAAPQTGMPPPILHSLPFQIWQDHDSSAYEHCCCRLLPGTRAQPMGKHMALPWVRTYTHTQDTHEGHAW